MPQNAEICFSFDFDRQCTPRDASNARGSFQDCECGTENCGWMVTHVKLFVDQQLDLDK